MKLVRSLVSLAVIITCFAPFSAIGQNLLIVKSCGCRCLDDNKDVIPIGGHSTWIAEDATNEPQCQTSAHGTACGTDGKEGKASCGWGYYVQSVADAVMLFGGDPIRY